jgi:hypothetical protein
MARHYYKEKKIQEIEATNLCKSGEPVHIRETPLLKNHSFLTGDFKNLKIVDVGPLSMISKTFS